MEVLVLDLEMVVVVVLEVGLEGVDLEEVGVICCLGGEDGSFVVWIGSLAIFILYNVYCVLYCCWECIISAFLWASRNM